MTVKNFGLVVFLPMKKRMPFKLQMVATFWLQLQILYQECSVINDFIYFFTGNPWHALYSKLLGQCDLRIDC